MATKKKKEVVDESTVEATNLPEATEKPEPQFVGTSAKLFPDLMDTAPVEEEEIVEDETGKVIVAEETPEVEDEPADEYLQLEALRDKKVKAKINGEEREVTLAELIKGYQTDRALTEKGQRIAEERRMMEELKNSLISTPKAEAEVDEDDYSDPKLLAQAKEIAEMKAKLAAYDQTLAPIQRERTLQNIARELKSQNSEYTDFMDKIPQIEEAIMAMPVEVQPQYDSELGFKSVYISLKNAELLEALRTPKETKVDSRPKPKVVKVESGGGSPSGVDDSAAEGARLHAQAMESGNWQPYLRWKGYI